MTPLQSLLIFVVAVAVFYGLLTLYSLPGAIRLERSKKLIAQFTKQTEEELEATDLQREILGKILLRITPRALLESLQRGLVQAGKDNPVQLKTYVYLKWGMAIGVLLAALLLPYAGISISPFVPLIGPVVGFFLPDLLLKSEGTKRNEQILADLPRAIDTLDLCVQAGMTIEGALKRVTQSKTGPLEVELQNTLQLLELGQTKAQAFSRLSKFGEGSELSNFANTIVSAERLGIPISGMLSQQSVEMRAKARESAKTQANKLPVKVLLPLMLFFLPALVMIVLGPAVIGFIGTFSGS